MLSPLSWSHSYKNFEVLYLLFPEEQSMTQISWFAALVCSVHPPFAFCGGWLCLQGAATKWQGSCFEGDFSISNSKGSFLLLLICLFPFLPLLIYALPPQEQQAKSHEAKSAKKGLKRSPDGHSHSAPSVSSRLAMQMIHEAFKIMLIKTLIINRCGLSIIAPARFSCNVL